MDPLEHVWRNEVLYLHSLWHQGPPLQTISKPRRKPKPKSNPDPNPNPNPKPNNLPLSNPTVFKNETSIIIKKKSKRGRRGKRKKDSEKPGSEAEWPIEPVPEPRLEIGWPESDARSVATTRPTSVEEQTRFAAVQLQQKGLKACQDYFSSKAGSDHEGEEDLMDEDDGDDDDDDDEGESEECKFFLGIFKEDSDLRSYYEKHFEGGEFCCLVCGGIGKKTGKRYKNCVALVQHSTSISKTKRKKAHRSFGRVICRVLGWDINRLPSIVLSMGEPLGCSLSNAESQVGLKANDDGENKDNENGDNEDGEKKEENENGDGEKRKENGNENGANGSAVGSVDADIGALGQEECLFQKDDQQGEGIDSANVDTGESMDYTVPLKKADLGTDMENIKTEIVDSVEADQEN